MAPLAPAACSLLAEIRRGDSVESIHAGVIAVARADGSLIAAAGDPEAATFLRSTAKPFQTAGLLRVGVAERFGWTDAEIALTAGSHSGEPCHTERVAALLSAAGFDDPNAVLQCGAQRPFHEPTAEALVATGQSFRPLHNNCSGKHAGMLAACVAGGYPIASYLDPDHPVQRAQWETLARCAGIPANEVGIGVDGCGVPTYRLTLRQAATALARLAGGDGLAAGDATAARRVFAAMRAEPHFVAGTGRLDTDLMAAVPGLVAKAGAEAFYGLALSPGAAGPDALGVAIKIADGSDRARGPIVREVLRQLGVLPGGPLPAALAAHETTTIVNRAGRPAGRIQPVFHLAPVPAPSRPLERIS